MTGHPDARRDTMPMMAPAPLVRPAVVTDRPAILEVVRDAFTGTDPRGVPRDGQEEVDIVARTWELGAAVDRLDLVAEEDDVIVGHVLTAWGELDGRPVAAIAPLGVATRRHGRGIGTALMTEVISRADLPVILLLGSPRYYGRFGFELAHPLGITYQGNDEHFQVRRGPTYDPSLRGEFVYCWELPEV